MKNIAELALLLFGQKHISKDVIAFWHIKQEKLDEEIFTQILHEFAILTNRKLSLMPLIFENINKMCAGLGFYP